jgi:hypothetical protein
VHAGEVMCSRCNQKLKEKQKQKQKRKKRKEKKTKQNKMGYKTEIGFTIIFLSIY